MVSRLETFHCRAAVMLAAAGALYGYAGPARSDPGANDYPTFARVQYVEECMSRSGGALAQLYQCSCAIDHIAQHLTYDEFVEASTFARYATLPGEGGGIFRDPDRAKQQAKLYRQVEGEAYKACGLKPPPR